MDRRSFLTAMSLVVGNLMTGCSAPARSVLRVRLLNGAVPAQVLGEFRSYLNRLDPADLKNSLLEFTPETQLQTLFSLLQDGLQRSRTDTAPNPWSGLPFIGDRATQKMADLVLLGDAWLGAAIQQKLIQPLDLNSLQGWQQLPQTEQWRRLITRNPQGEPDLKGKVWGVPYRWGTTVIAYRKDIFAQRGLPLPTDWHDLWRPELQRRISVLDQPRQVIGLTLKKLGQSYNTSNLQSVRDLRSQLDGLRAQVKLYSSDSYLQPLLLGDTWVAVGWSGDVLSVIQRNPKIAAVVPQSGTALWAEMWVRPVAQAAVSAIAQEWIKFTWQPTIAGQISLLSQAASPILLTQPEDQVAVKLRQNKILLPDPQIINNSEFLLPIAAATIAQYQTLWQQMRN